MHLATASVARSIVVEKMVTGSGVHYARAKDPYRRPERYRDGDPRFTWHYVTRAMDALRGAGLIEHVVGEWWPHTKGFESVAWATDELMALVGPLVDVSEHRGISKKVDRLHPARSPGVLYRSCLPPLCLYVAGNHKDA